MVPCPVCSDADCRTAFPSLFFCSGCTHLFQHPPVVTAVYDAAYVAERYDKYATTELMSHLRLGLLAGAGVPVGAKVMDVGPGNGSFVRLARKYGYDAYGNDANPTEYEGVRRVSLEDVNHWDAVTMFDSLEHFSDLAPVRGLFQRTDVLVVSTPDRPPRFPNIWGWKHYRPGEHLHYFSKPSLLALLSIDLRAGVHWTHAEDVIRGTLPDGAPNILTMIATRP